MFKLLIFLASAAMRLWLQDSFLKTTNNFLRNDLFDGRH